MESYLSVNITTAATTTVCSTGCIIHSIVINKDSGYTIAYKNGSTTLGTLEASAPHGPYPLHIACPDSLVIVTATSYDGDITVMYELMGA